MTAVSRSWLLVVDDGGVLELLVIDDSGSLELAPRYLDQ